MDIALKTLVLIIFILVPGFLFRRVYYQGTFSKQFDSKTWSHSLFYSALFGIIINFLAYNCYENFITIIDYRACFKFYNSISKESITEEDLEGFNIQSIYKYLSMLYGLSIVVAWVIYLIVRNFKLDRYFAPLRFSDHWHYYFRGEIKDFKEFSLSKGKCSIVTVDVLVKSEKSGNNIYSGLLSSYSLDNSGTLESISLTKAQIFKQETKTFKDIHSTVFIIPNSNIQNINLRYTFQEDDNTTINFILASILVCLLFYFWIDIDNIFKNYNLISKILLKLFASVICFFAPLILYALNRIVVLHKKEKTMPKGASKEVKKDINDFNTKNKIERDNTKKGFALIFSALLILIVIFVVILYFTR